MIKNIRYALYLFVLIGFLLQRLVHAMLFLQPLSMTMRIPLHRFCNAVLTQIH